MKNFFRMNIVAIRAVISVLVAVALLTGCEKKETGTSAQTSGRAIKSAEKTSFDEVTSRLDPGGNLYAYLSTSQWLDGLSKNIDGWRDAILALPSIPEKDRANVTKAFDLLTRLVRNSGVENITGVGLSGIALEPGYYQTKFFVHRDSSADGYIWSVTGNKSRPLTELDWLPAETAWATFGDFDVSEAWKILNSEVDKAHITELSTALKAVGDNVKKATGADLTKLLSSLDGRYGVLLTLDPSRTVQIPVPQTGMIEIPEPGLLIAIKVKDDQLFSLVDLNLKNMPMVTSVEKDGLKARTMAFPLPLPIAFRPTIARYGEYLFLASSDELVQRIVEVKEGRKPGIKSTQEFQRLAKGMPEKGNHFAYLSENMGKTIQQVQQMAMNSAAAKSDKDDQAATMLMQKIFQSNPPGSSYAVGGHIEDGWLGVVHGTKNPVNVAAAPLIIAPIAVLAGITVPAFAKAKDKATSVTCVNNMKQIGLAARIWAADHNGVLPPDLVSMKEELGTAKILICPADKSAKDIDTSTWNNFTSSMSSYEFLLPSASENSGIEKKIMVRCRIHGHTGLGDCSVQQATANARASVE